MRKKIVLTCSVGLCILSIAVYIIIRAVFLDYSGYTGINKFCAIILLSTEIFILLHTVGYFLDIVRSSGGQLLQDTLDTVAHTTLKSEPCVAVIIAARHEPREVLEETLLCLKNLSYKNKEIYFLDDSSDERFKKEAETLTKELNVHLFTRKVRHGAKAGMVNDFLKEFPQAKYIAIFDADQCPFPDFLTRIIPILEHDKHLAFVQTPQFYTNISESRVANAATLQQCVFYEYICEGKSAQNAMFCCGTNVVFRREALDDVGGLDESTITEDFATSLKLHQKGWKSHYYNHAYAFGKAPEDLNSYFKQQFRWANGTISVLKRVVMSFFSNPRSLSLGQWWEYFLSGSYYYIGLAFFMLVCFPILYLLFHVSAFFLTPELYFLAGLPYILFSFVIFYSVLGARNYKIGDLFSGQMLIQISFPVHIKAAAVSFFGIKSTFTITEKVRGEAAPYRTFWPQLSLMTLSFIACIWGLNRFIYERDAALLINCFWALYHCGVLSSVFYFNEERQDTH